jgi:hypothetical protein
VNFGNNHLLFTHVVRRKDPITRRIKRSLKTGKRKKGYYGRNGRLLED